jgi:tetratricopeptide (TPR) repeat protein
MTTPASSSSPKVAATSTATPAWIATYNRNLNLARSAFNSKDFAKAKEEYNKALALANKNGDKQKTTFVNERIAACDQAIEEANQAKAAEQQAAIQTRLEAYNFVGKFKLGTDYFVVQRKSDNRWGVITVAGVEAEAFTYSQISSRLKNNGYALKNDEGWVVFDHSLNKVATNINKLDDYK